MWNIFRLPPRKNVSSKMFFFDLVTLELIYWKNKFQKYMLSSRINRKGFFSWEESHSVRMKYNGWIKQYMQYKLNMDFFLTFFIKYHTYLLYITNTRQWKTIKVFPNQWITNIISKILNNRLKCLKFEIHKKNPN